MELSPTTVHAIALGGAIAFTPIVMALLSRLVPPREGREFDFERLKQKHSGKELLSQVVALAAMWTSLIWASSRNVNTPWLIGTGFGALVGAPVIFIAILTLPKGKDEWSEFWLFYELKYKVGVRFLFPLFGLVVGIGIVSVIVLTT